MDAPPIASDYSGEFTFPDIVGARVEVVGLVGQVHLDALRAVAAAGIRAVVFVDLTGHPLDGQVHASVNHDEDGTPVMVVDVNAPHRNELIADTARLHTRSRALQANARGQRHLRSV